MLPGLALLDLTKCFAFKVKFSGELSMLFDVSIFTAGALLFMGWASMFACAECAPSCDGCLPLIWRLALEFGQILDERLGISFELYIAY